MRRKLKIVARGLLVAATVVIIVLWLRYPAMEEAFQRDADITRLRHLEHYGSLIEEYRRVTGKVPFQGDAPVPIYIHVANESQLEYAKNGPPTPHKVVPVAELIRELEDKLGRTVDEFYDPQSVPTSRPNFYIYMVTGEVYFFAIHVHQPFRFAKKIADNYYKIEITNGDAASAWKPETLFDDPNFKRERDKPIVKRLFSLRDDKYRHFTKRDGAAEKAK